MSPTNHGSNPLSAQAMSRLQILAVALSIGLNGLDGFDVLSISFASPGIATAWGINRAALGIVLSMELIGMAAGSMTFGGLADRFGRRPVVLGCLVLMACGMTLASTATSPASLSAWRLLTGLGIGGMLATTNAVAAEFSNTRRRSLCVSLMGIGFPVGAVIGGYFASMLLRHHDWRAVFWLGAGATISFIPLVLWLMPESVPWLCLKQPRGALERVNQTLGRMQRTPLQSLPPSAAAPRRVTIAEIFAPGMASVTVLITIAYFLHIVTFYFILKWVPKIVVDMGFAPATAAGVLVWANVGGATGGALLGFLAQRVSVRALTIVAMLVSTVMVTVFGHGQANLQQLALVCAATGFFTNAGVVGIYTLIAHVYPTATRAFGTGFVIGVGRGGAALAPIIAGLLFTAGFGLQSVAVTMSVGSLIAAAALWKLSVPQVSVGGH